MWLSLHQKEEINVTTYYHPFPFIKCNAFHCSMSQNIMLGKLYMVIMYEAILKSDMHRVRLVNGQSRLFGVSIYINNKYKGSKEEQPPLEKC